MTTKVNLFKVFTIFVVLIILFAIPSTLAQCLSSGSICGTDTSVGVCCPELYCYRSPGWSSPICIRR